MDREPGVRSTYPLVFPPCRHHQLCPSAVQYRSSTVTLLAPIPRILERSEEDTDVSLMKSLAVLSISPGFVLYPNIGQIRYP
jgi:hypothetical protein